MRIFSEIGEILPFNKIPISKSKRTLNSYQEYWEKIMILIGDIIKGIIVSD